MTEEIRRYKSMGDVGSEESNMTLTAFVGDGLDENNPRRSNIQFTINGEYCCLTESQLLDLIHTISCRLLHRDQFTATGMTKPKITVHPDGLMEATND